MPFDGLPVGSIKDKVLAGERPPVGLTVNGKLASLMRLCWAAEPSARPTMAKVLCVVSCGLCSVRCDVWCAGSGRARVNCVRGESPVLQGEGIKR